MYAQTFCNTVVSLHTTASPGRQALEEGGFQARVNLDPQDPALSRSCAGGWREKLRTHNPTFLDTLGQEVAILLYNFLKCHSNKNMTMVNID